MSFYYVRINAGIKEDAHLRINELILLDSLVLSHSKLDSTKSSTLIVVLPIVVAKFKPFIRKQRQTPPLLVVYLGFPLCFGSTLFCYYHC